ncbi:Hypothetical predicted protein [Podarcis lilfordi]|uniref:Uncharacterized protein n=1 Tax=Podarcis lilfordi TaxID=74358 RepID=A0AA35PNB5_9SAUR|nr:Hypothetical predicted protein [Podarcis lilfordi]
MLRGPLAFLGFGSAQEGEEKGDLKKRRRRRRRRKSEGGGFPLRKEKRGRRGGGCASESERTRSRFPSRLPSPSQPGLRRRSLGLRPRSRGRGRAALPEPKSPARVHRLSPGARSAAPSPALQRRTRLANPRPPNPS